MARRTLLALLGVLVVLGGASFGVHAAAAKPDFALAAGPTSQSLQQGRSADYTVRADGATGFTGSVALAASGLPYGATATFSPASVPLSATLTTGHATLHVTTAPGTPAGTFAIRITGTGGGRTHAVGVQLVVNRALSSSFAMTAAPASVTVAPGATAVYSLTLARRLFPYPVALSAAGLPAGASATFSPNPLSGTAATLQVATTTAAKAGSYPLTLVATSQGSSQRIGVTLVVDGTAGSKPFTLSGAPAGALAPGAAPARVDLLIANPNNRPLAVTGLTVTITGTNRTGCTAGDFRVTQYGGAYPLTVPKNSARRLTQLGATASQLPRVAMLDLARNQDACKSATVSLSYSGSAQGN